jgi:hypothetical protein
MHALKTAAAMEQFLHTTPDPELRGLLADRVQALSEYDDYDLGELIHFYVVETAEELQSLNLPEIVEVRADYAHWTELVYVLSDDGFGLEVFVRKGLI